MLPTVKIFIYLNYHIFGAIYPACIIYSNPYLIQVILSNIYHEIFIWTYISCTVSRWKKNGILKLEYIICMRTQISTIIIIFVLRWDFSLLHFFSPIIWTCAIELGSYQKSGSTLAWPESEPNLVCRWDAMSGLDHLLLTGNAGADVP